ncbi:hypothetical protein HYY71_02705 [Candidatus Woesearchaeota archaeon]|nr:hypothetical protein [Candidatus Woesearchaeota archaeon]
MLKPRAQSAIEFIVLASFMTLVILGLFAVTGSRALEAKEEGNRKTAEDIADFAYREIEIAKSVNDGYTRVFNMPQTVNGVNYSIALLDNRELIVNYLGNEHILFVPANVSGSIGKGINIISKKEGIIFIYATDVQLPPLLVNLIMKNNIFNAARFDNKGNVILKGTIQQLSAPQPTSDDEFILKNSAGESIAIINLATGNMLIKGSVYQNQLVLAPSQLSNDFIVKDSAGTVVSYIDEQGNFYLKGTLTQIGNP